MRFTLAGRPLSHERPFPRLLPFLHLPVRLPRRLFGWRDRHEEAPRAVVTLLAWAVWLLVSALAQLQFHPELPGIWVLAAPVLLAALSLPPRHVAGLGAFSVALFAWLAATGSLALGEIAFYGSGVLVLISVAVVGATHRHHARAVATRREVEASALRNLDQLKTELLSTISHELRTPLTVIHGYAQMLETRARAGTADPVWLGQTAARLRTSSEELTRLVHDLLEFGQLERGGLAVEPAVFDLAALVQEVVARWHVQPGGSHLVCALSGRQFVYADRLRVTQVVSNLVENALKYAPDGEIVLRARRVGQRRQRVRLEVEDSGPGIPRDEQARIWEKLYRGRNVAGLNVVRGSGIGLALVKTLVEAQGGRVGLSSTPGLGTCFWVELPLAKEHPAEAEPQSA
ncbi:MAG TPA: HAMP domain-containing sensor histidine kinase [Chloroflexota bacterium]|nr:HAMP domain-containing sensor histidine kinase [Chloroflexota bacterium]